MLALVLGVWKYRQITSSEDHRAHPYVDIAHRAAAGVVVFFFVAAILTYISHGARRDTASQFENPGHGSRVAMVLLIVGQLC